MSWVAEEEVEERESRCPVGTERRETRSIACFGVDGEEEVEEE